MKFAPSGASRLLPRSSGPATANGPATVSKSSILVVYRPLHRKLIEFSGTAADLADYYRMPVSRARPRIAELVASGDIVEILTGATQTPSRELNGQNLLDPVNGAGTYQSFSDRPLFGAGGPSKDDVVQGGLANCYYLAGLSAVAKQNANRIKQSVVDLGDVDGLIVQDPYRMSYLGVWVLVKHLEGHDVSGRGTSTSGVVRSRMRSSVARPPSRPRTAAAHSRRGRPGPGRAGVPVGRRCRRGGSAPRRPGPRAARGPGARGRARRPRAPGAPALIHLLRCPPSLPLTSPCPPHDQKTTAM